MNQSELLAETGRLLGDPNNARWSNAVKLIRLNMAMDAVQADSKAIRTKATYTPVAGTKTVTLSAGTLDIYRGRIKNSSGDYKPLDGIPVNDLDFKYPNWMNWDDGEPIGYYFDPSTRTLNFVPGPDSDWAQTDGLDVWEVLAPTDMADDADVPFDSNTLMIPYHPALPHWAAAQCFLDDATPEAMSKALLHRSGDRDKPGEYEKWIAKIVRNFSHTTDVPATIKWKPEGGRISSRQPSKSSPLG